MSDKIDVEKKLSYLRGLNEVVRVDGASASTFLRGLLTVARDEDRQHIKWVLNNIGNAQGAAYNLGEEAIKLCNLIPKSESNHE